METTLTIAAGFEGELAALGGALLWAVAAVLYAVAVQRIPPRELNLVKGVLALALLAVTLLVTGDSLASVEPLGIGLLLISGAIGIGLGDTAYFSALNALGPRRTLLMGMLAPPLSGLIALVFLAEHLTLGAWLGILLTLAGVAWVITERSPNDGHRPSDVPRGVAFGLLAALTQALSGTLSRAAFTYTTVSPLWSSFLRLGAGVAILAIWVPLARRPAAGWLKASHGGRFWGVLFLAVFLGTFLGIWLQQVSFKHTEAGIAQTLLATSPLFVLPLAMWMGERVSPRAAFGVIVSLAGIALLFGLA